MSLMPFWNIRGFRFVKLVEFSQPAIEMADVGFSAAPLGHRHLPGRAVELDRPVRVAREQTGDTRA